MNSLVYFLVLLFLKFDYLQAGSFTVDYPNHQFLKDGKPFRYISGEIHYARVHPDYWNDRLSKIRAAGLNAVQVYIPWNLHEPLPGTFVFSDSLNVTRFLSLAQQNGLFVLLRAGPYIDAEWEFGGLPSWLLKYPGIKIRTSDTNYINAVRSYFATLLPMLKPYMYQNGGPILMVQPENEYGSFGWQHCDRNYQYFLRDLFREYLGNETVLYTTDNPKTDTLGCGSFDGTFTTVDFFAVSDSQINSSFRMQQNYSKGGPYVDSEFNPGWLITWGQTTQNYPTLDVYMNSLKYVYSLNASFNMYMFHGGTNFGFNVGSQPTASGITSYDYVAPISENGAITQKYQEIRSFIQSLPDWEYPPLALPSNNSVLNYGHVTFNRIGTNLISTITQLQETCHSSTDPLDFEQIDHAYGFVLYTTTLVSQGVELSAPNIKDYGYVYLNNVYQGMLDRHKNTSITLLGASNGDILRILVENYGRRAWTLGDETDPKGLRSGVTLDNATLQNWYTCGINLTKESIELLSSSYLNHFKNDKKEENLREKALSQPGIYIGTFNASDIEDTFFDPTGWSKGQLFVNGNNLGRYWPTAGPQVTLYVPKPYLQQKNTVILIELLGTQQNTAQFIDHAVWSWK